MLNHLCVTNECDRQTDGRADTRLANAALNYVALLLLLLLMMMMIKATDCGRKIEAKFCTFYLPSPP